MPQIDFSFSGWVQGASIQTVTVNETGESLDVSNMAPETLAARLESGEYSISLGDYLYENNRKAEIEITDFWQNIDALPGEDGGDIADPGMPEGPSWGVGH